MSQIQHLKLNEGNLSQVPSYSDTMSISSGQCDGFLGFNWSDIRHGKNHDRCDRRGCQAGWGLCQSVVSWDLFLGAYHFCSIKTVDLATI